MWWHCQHTTIQHRTIVDKKRGKEEDEKFHKMKERHNRYAYTININLIKYIGMATKTLSVPANQIWLTECRYRLFIVLVSHSLCSLLGLLQLLSHKNHWMNESEQWILAQNKSGIRCQLVKVFFFVFFLFSRLHFFLLPPWNWVKCFVFIEWTVLSTFDVVCIFVRVALL